MDIVKQPEAIKAFRDPRHAIEFHTKNCETCAKIRKCAHAAQIEIVIHGAPSTWYQISKHHTPPKTFFTLESDKIGYCRLYRAPGASVKRQERGKQASSYETSDNADTWGEEPLFKNHA